MRPESIFEDWLEKLVACQTDPVIVATGDSLVQFRKLATAIPPEIEWEIVSAEIFSREQENLVDAGRKLGSSSLDIFEALAGAYWRDQAGMAIAYRAMVLLRIEELVSPAIHLLNARELLGPAVLVRAAFELAALYAHELRKVVELFQTAASKSPGQSFEIRDEAGNVIDAEKVLVRAIWGWKAESGAGGQQPEELRQLNALTAIRKFSQINPRIGEIYDYLCQVAHPNFAGNARFWTNMRNDRTGRPKVAFGRKSEGPNAKQIRIVTLWALGWSAATVTRFSYKLEDAIAQIFRRWPVELRH